MPTKFKGQAFDRREADLEPLPDIDARRGEYEILGWDLEPGDAIAFSFLTVHGAPGNAQSANRRRAFAARNCGDDVVFARRPGEGSPPFPAVRSAARRVGQECVHPCSSRWSADHSTK